MSELKAPVLWCATLSAICIGFALVAHPGIPAYRHDWQWPVDAASFASWFSSKLDAWNWQGLGAPNIAIQVHPFFAINALAAGVFPSKLILTAWLTAAAAVAAAGAAQFVIVRFGVRPLPAMVTGVLYCLSPLVANKMVAGHVAYLLGYALVPWLVVATLSRNRAAPWAVGLCLAWISIQLQLLVFGVILALIISSVKRGFRNLLPVALAAGAVLPYAWALLRPAASQVTTAMHTSVPWELAQSASLSEALRGIGYFAGYWELAVASFFGSAWLPWVYLSGIVLAFIVRREGVWRLAAIYILGALLVCGLKGPLAGPLSWMFEHVAGASAFRELYNAAIFLAFAGAAGAGVALNAIPLVKVQLAVALTIAILAVAPWLTGGVLNQAGSAFVAPTLQRAKSAITMSQSPSRFYLAPGANPVGPSSWRAGGADPAAFNMNHAAPFWVYLVHGEEGAVIWALQRGDGEANDVARSLGMSVLIAQPNIVTKFRAISTSGRNLSIEEFSGGLPNIPGWAEQSKKPNRVLVPSGVPGTVLRLINEHEEFAKAPSVQQETLSAAIHGLPIVDGWVPAQDWWFLSERVAQAAPHGIVTSARNAILFIQCPVGRLAAGVYAAGQGTIGTTLVKEGTWQKLRIACGDTVGVHPIKNGYIVVTSGEDLAAWDSLVRMGTLSSVQLDIKQHGDELVASALDDCRRCSIVLSEQWSPGWLLSIGGMHIPATALPSGYSAWSVDLTRGEIIRVTYRPASEAIILEWCAAFCWAWLVGALVWSLMRRHATIAGRG